MNRTFLAFILKYIDEEGAISTAPEAIDDKNRLNLLIGRWHA